MKIQCKKKLCSVVLMIVMIINIGAVPVSAASATSQATVASTSPYFSNGNGTIENPYQITNSNQLQYMSDAYSSTNGVNQNYILQNDINMNGSGTGIDSFSGNFNGNGHTISNLNGRLVTTNYGTIRNVVLNNPSYTELSLPPTPGNQMSNYDRQIETVYNGTLYYSSYNNSVVTYFYKENFGFAAGKNESSGIVDNVTVTGGTMKAYYSNNQIINDVGGYYDGMIKHAPGRLGGIVGFNEYGKVTNCTVKNLTINADSSLGVVGGIIGYNLGSEVIGCVADTVKVKKVGSLGEWIDTDGKTSVSRWAVGGIIGYGNCYVKSCYSENTDSYAADQSSTGDLPVVGFRKAGSFFDINTGDSALIGQDEAFNSGNIGVKLTGNCGVAMNVTEWNARVDANTYPGLKKRDPSDYHIVVEYLEGSNQVEVRYYDNTGKLLNIELKPQNSTFTIPTYTKTVWKTVNNANTEYLCFVDQYVVSQTANGAILPVTNSGDTVTLGGSIDIKWNMPLTPYVKYSTVLQKGNKFAVTLSLYTETSVATPINEVYTAEQQAAMIDSINVNYTKEENTVSSIETGAYGNYVVTLDPSEMTYKTQLKNAGIKSRLWYIGPLTGQQASIANTLNGATGTSVSANIPVLKNSGVSYEVWYEGTNGTQYPSSSTPPSEIGDYIVSVKNVGEFLGSNQYEGCWQATAGPVELGMMSISSSGLTVFTEGSDIPSTDKKFTVSYESGGEQKSITYTEGSSSINTGAIPASATDVVLKYDDIVVKRLTDFDPLTPYRYDLVKLTVYNAADGNLKGDTLISDHKSISGYDGILQFWVEKGETLGEVLTKKPEFGILTLSSWVDGEDPTIVYPDSTPVNTNMAIAAKYTDTTDESGFVIGEKYYFFDEDFGFSKVYIDNAATITHYFGYYGGTVRSNVGSVEESGGYGTYTTGSQAQLRRLFLTPVNMIYTNSEVYEVMNKGLCRSYVMNGQNTPNGIQRLPSNNYDKQNGYPDGNGFWRVNPWNDRTQLYVNLGADKVSVTGGVKELGLYRNGETFSYTGDNNIVGLSNNVSGSPNNIRYFDKTRMFRLVYDMDMTVTKNDYWQINLHLIDGAKWNFGNRKAITNPINWMIEDRVIHYIATNADTQSLIAPGGSYNAGDLTLDTSVLASIYWEDEEGNRYFPGEPVPRGTTDLYMKDADQLLATLEDEAACAAVGLDSSYVGYYPIDTVDDLILLKDVVNAMSSLTTTPINVVLLCDLDMSSVKNWCAIGYSGGGSPRYSGTFDGNGHSIWNLNSTSGGLFDVTGNIIIKDLTIASGNISGSNYAGAFLSKIYPIVSTGTVSGKLINCANYASVTGGTYGGAGGLIGYAGVYPMTFERCYNLGNVSGSNYSGSIFGPNKGDNVRRASVTITDCYGIGTLYGGYTGAGAAMNITNSYVTDSSKGGTGVTLEQLTNGEVAWKLNTKGGTQENSGFWSQSVTNPVFANSTTSFPAYRVTFSGDGFTTAYAYTNAQGTVISMPESVSGKLLTYDTSKTFTATTAVTSDLTVTVGDPGGNITDAPIFVENGTTYLMQGAAPKTAAFMLSSIPTTETTYAIYSAATGGTVMGTVNQSGTTLTVTLKNSILADSVTYYIAAQEEGKAESIRTAVICNLKPEPIFTNAISNVTAAYEDESIEWNNPLQSGDGVITFNSSNTNVAEVDTKGALAIKAVGTSLITISVAEANNNRAKTFTYTVTVVPRDVTATKAETTQNIIMGVGSFTQPVFDQVTGELTYGFHGVTGYTYEKTVAYLQSLDQDATANISYSYAANGNYTGTISGTIAMTVNGLNFTGNGLTVKETSIYGNSWSDIITIDENNYTAMLDTKNVAGNYRVQVRTNGSDYSDLIGSTIPAVGCYDYQVLFTSTDQTFVDIVVTYDYVNITKATISVTANDKTIIQGSELPTRYDVTYSGFVGNDNKESVVKTEVTVTCSVTESDTITTYEIIPSGGELNAPYNENYQFSYRNGTLSVVDKTPVTITGLLAPVDRSYNGSTISDREFGTPSYSPMWNGTLTYTYYSGEIASGTPLDTAPKAAGTYTVRIAIPKEDEVYVGHTDVTFTIQKATIVVIADNKSMTTDGTLPTFSIRYTGIANGDTEESIFSTKAMASCAGDGKAAGNYPITVTKPVLTEDAANNYTVGTLVNGALYVSNPYSGGSSPGGGVPIVTPEQKQNQPEMENGGTGWEAIKETLDLIKDGTAVTIEMNGNTTVPMEILQSIQGKNITLVFDFGNGIKWSINGQKIEKSGLKEANLGVTLDTENVPNEVIDQMAGEQAYRILSLSHDGLFGFTSALTIGLGEEYSGKYGNLFYFDPVTKQLLLQTVGKIGLKGDVEFSIYHASDYVVIISDEPMLEAELQQIAINTVKGELYVGGTEKKNMTLKLELPQLLKEVIDNDSINLKITYQSSQPKVATVTKNGEVIAKKTGKTVITTLVTMNGVEKRFETKITVSKAYIKLAKSTKTLKIGETFTFKAIGYGFKSKDIKFYTSKKSIVVIGKSTGKASAISKGTDYVVAKIGNTKVAIKVKVL